MHSEPFVEFPDVNRGVHVSLRSEEPTNRLLGRVAEHSNSNIPQFLANLLTGQSDLRGVTLPAGLRSCNPGVGELTEVSFNHDRVLT